MAECNETSLSHGCTDVCINEPDIQLLGHNEDTMANMLNHFYFVSAHIIEEDPQGRYGMKEERFTSLCYAGQLPGYTMSHNKHGLIFAINALNPIQLGSGKMPRTFLTRALLGAQTLDQVLQILTDEGEGAADGCAVNLTFLK